ncbi:alpha/beta hydrolase [Streptomyces sp. NPDC001034]|uniref:alpha/beta fold hydrolase n=1 Tax=Streptomyces sp. NPDC001034 TaxID=3154375 RepID=UPI0033182EA0
MPAVTTAEGTEVDYRISGSGPGLLLVHGSTSDSASNFALLEPHLTPRRTLLLPDYAGSGRTPLPAGGSLTVDVLAGQLAAVVEHRSAGPVDVAGASLGAVVAAALAADHPHLVRRLVLIVGWARNDDPRQSMALGLWRHLAETDEWAYQRYITLLAHSPDYLAALGGERLHALADAPVVTEGARRQLDLDLVADIRDRLGRVLAPTLVIGASRDQVVPVAHARELHAGIAGSRYAELDSGHNVLLEKPRQLAELIDDFLD